MDYPTVSLAWNPAYRVIPSRFPSIDLFKRIANPAEYETLFALDAMTNDRLRHGIAPAHFLSAKEHPDKEGDARIMAAFSHLNPQGSRFSQGSYGVFYCAKKIKTAVAETCYHQRQFMTATSEPAMRLQMLLCTVSANGTVVDLRKACLSNPKIVDPSDYSYSQAVGLKLQSDGSAGIIYPSVRDKGGECLAAFTPAILKKCVHAKHLEYAWNGHEIEAVFEITAFF